MDATQLMYEAANRAYAEIGEHHGYTGLTHGLAAVAREAGVPREPRYFSTRFHDPLVEFHNQFGNEQLTFAELMQMWDRMWFGHGTGKLGSLPYPFDESHARSRYAPSYHDFSGRELKWMEDDVTRTLKKQKIRRGTKKYQDFINKYTPRVVNAAVETAQKSALESLPAVERDLAKRIELRDTAQGNAARLREEAELREALLREAGLTGSPLTDREFEHQYAAWQRAAEACQRDVAYTVKTIEWLKNGNQQAITAIEAMRHSPELKPFAIASGLLENVT
jgi:hypothetical protein